MTQSQVSNYLRFSCRILIKLLVQSKLAKTSVPNSTEIENSYRRFFPKGIIFQDKKSWGGGGGGTMDGLKFLLQQSHRFIIQLSFYNYWIYDQYLTNFFSRWDNPIFCINCPGVVHDSKVGEMSELFQNLKKMYVDFNATLTVDSDFSFTRYPFFIKSSESS